MWNSIEIVVKCYEVSLCEIGKFFLDIFGTWGRHERDSRQSPTRSGEVSKVSRQRFAGFRLKVPFSFARSSGKAISWTRRYDTLTAREIWLFWSGTRTGKYRARNGNVPFEYVRVKNSVRLPSKAKNFLKRKFQFSG